jgi:hypothetical protein
MGALDGICPGLKNNKIRMLSSKVDGKKLMRITKFADIRQTARRPLVD